ncbi:hypothetical protein ATE69_13620 [Sphingopyxis sp. H071]|nr:hypothetical protein ATE61_14320 [Sphingopyxis sp. H057]KTE50386.1 hypothetical protein ATE64_16240 [Sphingopyxis sp. H073]KTE52475.1 hypothetical protein ATE69_13620 [Sphingopyxis sp. H071]KTE62968.1 hypothetical protein ATE66_01140 [Sphingopyxis sp. H107]KTE72200.1 hypothetical protein ATE60_10370 [Sphingopyxis sp. H081]KTE79731.1 hypothetical protein ATE63_13790 [Sphingopyxis sp. H067]
MAQLDDRSAGRVTCRFDVGEYDMMGAPIHAVNDGICAPLELIMQTALDQSSNDRFSRLGVENKAFGRALDVPFFNRAMHAFDDVISYPKIAQSCFSILVERPAP